MKNGKKLWKEWRGIIYFIFFMVLFRSAVADWYLVPTGSMKPTILEGDYVLTNRLAYQLKLPFTDTVLAKWDKPKRGDIVVFDSPADGTRLVKRVVGLPGDTVAMLQNRVFINGQEVSYESMSQEQASKVWPQHPPLLLKETLGDVHHTVAVHDDLYSPYQSFPEHLIPAGQYFMMGDNRDNSGDSRIFGTVDSNLISGKADYILLSLDWGKSYLPRSGRALTHLE